MSREFNVYGIGNAIVDMQLKISEEKFQELGLEKAGMRLVSEDEQESLLSKFKELEINQASGGSAANSMIALSQLGGKAAYGCLIANDDFGSFYATEMKDLGITLYTTPPASPDDGKTGSSVILITPDAERTMNTFLGVSADFGPEHVSSRLVKNADWLFVEGYLFSSPRGQEAVKTAISYASKNGTRVAVVLSDTFIVDNFSEPLKDALKYTDLVMANFQEAAHLTSETKEEEILNSLSKFAPNYVMTKGDEGARVLYDGEKISVDASKVKAVDETGAGDMFAGTFLYGISNGLSAEASAKLACALSAKIVSKIGPRLGDNYKELILETRNDLSI